MPRVIGVQDGKAEDREGHHQARRRARSARTPIMPGRNEPAIAAASASHRRCRQRHRGQIGPRPLQPAGDFHDAAGQPEIENVGQRRARRRPRDEPGDRSALVDVAAAASAQPMACRRPMRHEPSSARRLVLIGRRNSESRRPRPACRSWRPTARAGRSDTIPIASPPSSPRARQQAPDSRATRPANPRSTRKRTRRTTPNSADRQAADAAATSAAQWLQPSAAIRIGSGAR